MHIQRQAPMRMDPPSQEWIRPRTIAIALTVIASIGTIVASICLYHKLGYASFAIAGAGVALLVVMVIVNRVLNVRTQTALTKEGTQNLWEAVREGNIGQVNSLLQEGEVDLEKYNWADETLLGEAARKGRLDVFQALVEGGADITKGDKYSLTPLYHACAYGHVEICRYLLDRLPPGAIHEHFAVVFRTPLDIAIEQHHFKLIESLVLSGKVNLQQKNHDGQTPLEKAYKEARFSYNDKGEQFAIFRLLISQEGACVDTPDARGLTLLQRELKESFINDQIVHVLVNEGKARIDIKVNGDTPIEFAAKQCKSEIFKILVAEGRVLKLLPDKSGFTPAQKALQEAIKNKYFEMSEVLVPALKVYLQDRSTTYGYSLLNTAIALKDESAVRLLITEGDVGVSNPYENPVLRAAFKKRDREEALMEAVHMCINNRGPFNIIKILVEEGRASINTPIDMLNDGPIHFAAASYNTAVLEYLLKHGGDPRECFNIQVRAPQIAEPTHPFDEYVLEDSMKTILVASSDPRSTADHFNHKNEALVIAEKAIPLQRELLFKYLHPIARRIFKETFVIFMAAMAKKDKSEWKSGVELLPLELRYEQIQLIALDRLATLLDSPIDESKGWTWMHLGETQDPALLSAVKLFRPEIEEAEVWNMLTPALKIG